jgi:hypothetical protein
VVLGGAAFRFAGGVADLVDFTVLAGFGSASFCFCVMSSNLSVKKKKVFGRKFRLKTSVFYTDTIVTVTVPIIVRNVASESGIFNKGRRNL